MYALYSYASGDTRNAVPAVEVSLHRGYAAVKFEHGEMSVSFFVHTLPDESIDDFVNRLRDDMVANVINALA